MARIREMIRETEAELAWARDKRNSVASPRRFLEVDAFAAATRLKALRECLAAVRDEGE